MFEPFLQLSILEMKWGHPTWSKVHPLPLTPTYTVSLFRPNSSIFTRFQSELVKAWILDFLTRLFWPLILWCGVILFPDLLRKQSIMKHCLLASSASSLYLTAVWTPSGSMLPLLGQPRYYASHLVLGGRLEIVKRATHSKVSLKKTLIILLSWGGELTF